MKISPNGLSLIKNSEGFSKVKYKDVVGNWTIGYGHLILPGENFDNGITEAQGEDLLRRDVEHVEIFLNAHISGLFQNEFDALCDFGFNLGTGALYHLLSHGINQVTDQIVLWDHAGGKEVDGLKARRLAEKALWDTEDHEG